MYFSCICEIVKAWCCYTCKLKSAASEWLLWGGITSAYLSLFYLWNYSIRLISITETSVLIRRYSFLRALWSEVRSAIWNFVNADMRTQSEWTLGTVQPVICLQTLTERRACGKVLFFISAPLTAFTASHPPSSWLLVQHLMGWFNPFSLTYYEHRNQLLFK